MVAHSGLITVMQRAARKAAPRLRRDFGEVEQLQVSRKGPGDFVSMADKRAEQTIVEELRTARPDWGMLLEEGGEIEGNPAKPRWIVLNKLDMIAAEERAERVRAFVKRLRWKGPVFSISALTREGCEGLIRAVYEHVAAEARVPAEARDPRFDPLDVHGAR